MQAGWMYAGKIMLMDYNNMDGTQWFFEMEAADEKTPDGNQRI